MRRLLLKSMMGIMLTGGIANAATLTHQYTCEDTLNDNVGALNLAGSQGNVGYSTTAKVGSKSCDVSVDYAYNNTVVASADNTWTSSFWLNATDDSNTDILCYAGDILLEESGLNIRLSRYNGFSYSHTDTISATSAILDGTWHLITVTSDGTDTKAYIDGVLKATINVSVTVNNLYYAYGLRGLPNGKIDDMRFYDDSLTADEVSALYASYTSSSSSTEEEKVVMATQAQTGGESSAPQAVLDSQISTSYSGTNNNNFTLTWSGPWNTDVYFEIYYRGSLLGITEAGARSYTVDLDTLSRATNGFTICAVNDVGSSCNASPIFTPWGLAIFLASLLGVRLWRRK